MSGRSYYSSSKSKPIIEYSESSADSRYYESGSSGSSRDEYYSSNTSMSHGSDAASREQRYRDAYDGWSHPITSLSSQSANHSSFTDRKFVTSTTSKSGRVEVVDHRSSRYDGNEPRSSDASSKHYKDTKKHRKDRRYE